MTVGLAAIWPRLFPALARIDRLEELIPATRKKSAEPALEEPLEPPVDVW